MLDRRDILAAGLVGIGVSVASGASACSLTARKNVRFSDALCQRQIEQFVDLLNRASEMAEEDVQKAVEELSVSLEPDLLWQGDKTIDDVTFFRTYRVSSGKLDTKPIDLREVTLIRQRGQSASYAFTLRRYSYHPADDEGCNGLFTHDEYWGNEDTGYIAVFNDNRLLSVREFIEWFAGMRA